MVHAVEFVSESSLCVCPCFDGTSERLANEADDFSGPGVDDGGGFDGEFGDLETDGLETLANLVEEFLGSLLEFLSFVR